MRPPGGARSLDRYLDGQSGPRCRSGSGAGPGVGGPRDGRSSPAGGRCCRFALLGGVCRLAPPGMACRFAVSGERACRPASACCCGCPGGPAGGARPPGAGGARSWGLAVACRCWGRSTAGRGFDPTGSPFPWTCIGTRSSAGGHVRSALAPVDCGACAFPAGASFPGLRGGLPGGAAVGGALPGGAAVGGAPLGGAPPGGVPPRASTPGRSAGREACSVAGRDRCPSAGGDRLRGGCCGAVPGRFWRGPGPGGPRGGPVAADPPDGWALPGEPGPPAGSGGWPVGTSAVLDRPPGARSRDSGARRAPVSASVASPGPAGSVAASAADFARSASDSAPPSAVSASAPSASVSPRSSFDRNCPVSGSRGWSSDSVSPADASSGSLCSLSAVSVSSELIGDRQPRDALTRAVPGADA